MRTHIFLAIAILFAALAGACQLSPSAPTAAEPATPGEPDAKARVVASAQLPGSAARIVSLAPNVTEIIFALGLGDKLVGATRYCDYPAAALDLPRMGGMLDPDFEAIVAARPDLVIGVLGGGDSRIGPRLERAKIPYAFLQMDTIAQTFAGIEQLGELAGDADGGRALAATLRQELFELARELAPLGDAARPSVLMVYDHQPVVAAGPGSFGHELIELAGLRNAAASIDNPYPVLDIEKVFELDPDRLIDATMSRSEEHMMGFWHQHGSLRAVREGAIVRFPDPVLLRAGPRLPEALKIVATATATRDLAP
ncbi:MAG: ABC transporter substrate-binding protein [Bradymonadaceae bacterium]|nr:ABC transporter substrate-binding protein [Lujinxingiaceae bacterium]